MTTAEGRGPLRRIVLGEGARQGLLLGVFMLVLLVLVTLPAFPILLETPFVVVGVVTPVAVYGLTGFRATQAAGRVVAGTLAGALVGAISGGISGLSVLVVDLLFFDSVSQQPEKILNFHASGLPTMRDYLIANGLHNGMIGLVLGTVGGAVIGVGSALISKRFHAPHHRRSRSATITRS